jgi:hypothetical protein
MRQELTHHHLLRAWGVQWGCTQPNWARLRTLLAYFVLRGLSHPLVLHPRVQSAPVGNIFQVLEPRQQTPACLVKRALTQVMVRQIVRIVLQVHTPWEGIVRAVCVLLDGIRWFPEQAAQLLALHAVLEPIPVPWEPVTWEHVCPVWLGSSQIRLLHCASIVLPAGIPQRIRLLRVRRAVPGLILILEQSSASLALQEHFPLKPVQILRLPV